MTVYYTIWTSVKNLAYADTQPPAIISQFQHCIWLLSSVGKHAPLRRYLPPELSVRSMYDYFIHKNPYAASYETYCTPVSSRNISFAKLGHEECLLNKKHTLKIIVKIALNAKSGKTSRGHEKAVSISTDFDWAVAVMSVEMQ